MRTLSQQVQQRLRAWAEWYRRPAPRRPFVVLLVLWVALNLADALTTVLLAVALQCGGRPCGVEANPITALLLAQGGWPLAEGCKLIGTLAAVALLGVGYRVWPRLMLWLAVVLDLVLAATVTSNLLHFLFLA